MGALAPTCRRGLKHHFRVLATDVEALGGRPRGTTARDGRGCDNARGGRCSPARATDHALRYRHHIAAASTLSRVLSRKATCLPAGEFALVAVISDLADVTARNRHAARAQASVSPVHRRRSTTRIAFRATSATPRSSAGAGARLDRVELDETVVAAVQRGVRRFTAGRYSPNASAASHFWLLAEFMAEATLSGSPDDTSNF
jgi:hypothetical protein